MSAAVRPRSAAGLLVASVAAATAMRVLVAGPGEAAASPGAAALFAAVLVVLAGCAGMRPRVVSWRGAGVGMVGGAALVCAALVLHRSAPVVWGRPAGAGAVVWPLLVSVVAVGEEMVFRGVLFDAVLRALGGNGGVASRGAVFAAACVGAVAFALVHVPLYGWGALPLDVAAGLWLGGLRVAGGGVAAPAVAHALADMGAWAML